MKKKMDIINQAKLMAFLSSQLKIHFKDLDNKKTLK